MSPEEMSAEILKSLKEDVRLQTHEDVRQAVITVPAAFGTLQCEATSREAIVRF
jgi:molecular chaperone DnaK